MHRIVTLERHIYAIVFKHPSRLIQEIRNSLSERIKRTKHPFQGPILTRRHQSLLELKLASQQPS
jgi:hypothetical protein